MQVRFLDKDAGFIENSVSVSDQNHIALHGENQSVIGGFGIQSAGQATRLARYILFSSLYETETISFTTGLEGAAGFIRPGSIIGTQDTYGHANRHGGRVVKGSVDADTVTVTLDHDPDVEFFDRFCWTGEDGEVYVAADVENITVNGREVSINYPGATDDAKPVKDGVWAANPIRGDAVDSAPLELWRVGRIVKNPDDVRHDVIATKLEPFKYAVCDRLDWPYERLARAFREARE